MLPQGSHRSGHAQLAHPAPRVTDSLRVGRLRHAPAGTRCACFATRWSFVEMVLELGVSVIVPPNGPVTRCCSPSAGSLGSVPPLRRYGAALRLLRDRPASLRHPSIGGTARADPCFADTRAGPRRAAASEQITGCPIPELRAESRRSPRFLGSPTENVPCSSTPAGPACSTAAARRYCLPQSKRRRLPRCNFRGSLTRPAPSLSTLRRSGHPDTTQDSLPAAGQRYRAGLKTRWAPSQGFSSSHPPHPSFPGALGLLIPGGCARRCRGPAAGAARRARRW